MPKFYLILCIALGLVACQDKPAEPVSDAPSSVEPSVAVQSPESPAAQQPPDFWVQLDDTLKADHRSEANRARDIFRHPKETLQFFDLQPDTTVIEITPGGGWYTEILGPWLKGRGKLIAALIDAKSVTNEKASAYYEKSNQAFREKIADTSLYGPIEVIEIDSKAPSLGSDNSVDSVVTFRNVHNWTSAGNDAAMFKAFFNVLKPGGWLGIEEHRAKPGTSIDKSKKSGYLTEEYVIKLATDAGFVLLSKSEINANPKDTTDHPNGVWTLPPTLDVPEGKDKAEFQAIGESDRMTLRFIKPKSTGVANASN